jgi:hypothetical protein
MGRSLDAGRSLRYRFRQRKLFSAIYYFYRTRVNTRVLTDYIFTSDADPKSIRFLNSARYSRVSLKVQIVLYPLHISLPIPPAP